MIVHVFFRTVIVIAPLHLTQVDDLKSKLASQEVELAQKNEDANKLIAIVGAETEKVSKEKAIADEEEKKVAQINVEVTKKQADCERDLAKAEPALLAAKEALNTLNKVHSFSKGIKHSYNFVYRKVYRHCLLI